MQVCETHMLINALYDPSKTTSLRNRFSRDMEKRFKELIKVIRISVVEKDVFGLKKIKTQQMTPANENEFDRDSYSEEIALFLLWLARQVELGILTKSQSLQIGRLVSANWTDSYIYEAYKRGIIRARDEMIRLGMPVPSIEASGGIEAIIATLSHAKRLELLYSSVYSELQGVTDAMRNQISQILSKAMIEGLGAKEIASELRAVIDGTNITELGITDKLGRFIPAARRAEMIARTEIIRSLHLAAVEEYRQWGVQGIEILAEWTTAKDGKVCFECGSLEGKVFTLDEIEGMIPLHPNCRCFILPVIL
jgi:SPP1 gp7 family putative phage head morphogenesis protein